MKFSSIDRVLVPLVCLFEPVITSLYRAIVYWIIKPLDNIYHSYTRPNNATRKRRLSDLDQHPSVITQLNKSTSSFLGKLPLELRQIIYELVYQDSKFVLTREGLLPSKHIAWMHDKDWRYLRKDPGVNRNYVEKGVLGLPLACRQLYTESINYIYRMPQFACYDLHDMYDLRERLLPQRWAALTSLVLRVLAYHISYFPVWDQFWQSVDEMPMMKRVELHIVFHRDDKNLALNERLVQPLLEVTNVPTFELVWCYGESSIEKYTSAPFRSSWLVTTSGSPVYMHLCRDGSVVECVNREQCCGIIF